MSYIKPHVFDEKVAERINVYIRRNGYRVSNIAEKAGFTYNQLYQILKKNQLIKLSDYIRICNALEVPFEKFVKGLNAER